MWFLALLLILILVLTISISWTHWRGALWAPTPMSMVHKMLKMADVGPDDLVYDLGCGDGRIVLTAARDYGARAVGIELDPLRYLWCQILITIFGLRSHVRIVYGDFFEQDISQADVVTCYLLNRTNKKLQEKFNLELKHDARVVSHYFSFPKFNLVCEDDEARLYLYSLERN